MRILAIVVTYFPDKELLKDNILSFIDEVEKVLIWENTPQHERNSYRFVNHDKVEYCGDGINSISRGMNYGWNYAKENGYDYLLTMDQDSVFRNFPKYKQAILDFEGNGNCIIGPMINIDKSFRDCYTPVPAIITSGMMIPITLLDKLGGYCSAFPVDGIDSELCIKATENGIGVFQYEGASIDHHFGEVRDSQCKKTVLLKNYSANRLYGIFMSHIVLLRKYKQNVWIKSIVKYYIRAYFVGVLLYDRQKLRKLLAILRGIKDGAFFDISKI